MKQRSFVSRLNKWRLVFTMLPLLIAIFLLKFVFHTYGLEILTLSALFTSVIAATTFLIGFLISGTISDYKESERLPGEMANSLETMYDELYVLNKNKGNESTKNFIAFYKDFLSTIEHWFHRKERTNDLINQLHDMNDHVAAIEPIIQPNFLTRLKNEQSNLRKMIIRIDTIRDVTFVQSAYAIAESLAFLVILSLLMVKVEPFYESVFFTLIVSFLVIYMILLIKDLDNPFDYRKRTEHETEVSIKPIKDLAERLLIHVE